MMLPVSPLVSDQERDFWIKYRQALLIQLGAIEDMLEMERSVIPQHRKKDLQQNQNSATIEPAS